MIMADSYNLFSCIHTVDLSSQLAPFVLLWQVMSATWWLVTVLFMNSCILFSTDAQKCVCLCVWYLFRCFSYATLFCFMFKCHAVISAIIVVWLVATASSNWVCLGFQLLDISIFSFDFDVLLKMFSLPDIKGYSDTVYNSSINLQFAGISTKNNFGIEWSFLSNTNRYACSGGNEL